MIDFYIVYNTVISLVLFGIIIWYNLKTSINDESENDDHFIGKENIHGADHLITHDLIYEDLVHQDIPDNEYDYSLMKIDDIIRANNRHVFPFLVKLNSIKSSFSKRIVDVFVEQNDFLFLVAHVTEDIERHYSFITFNTRDKNQKEFIYRTLKRMSSYGNSIRISERNSIKSHNDRIKEEEFLRSEEALRNIMAAQERLDNIVWMK